MAGCLVIVLFLAIAAAVSALLGVAAAWVLGFFHVIVPWYVCSVGLFILGTIFGRGAASK